MSEELSREENSETSPSETSLDEAQSGCAVVGLFWFWVFLLGCTAMRNWDIWWHLSAGRLILEQGAVPTTDVFSYSSLDRPWIDLHWGFQLLVTAAFNLGGVTLLILLKALCLSIAVMIGWSAGGSRTPVWLKALCWSVAVVCLMGRSMIRPEMLSLIFLAVWLWALHDTKHVRRRIWLLPFVQVLWVNCHGLFALGFTVGAAFLADYLARRFAKGRAGLESPHELGPLQLMLAGAASLGACFLNPYLLEGVLFPEVLYRKFSTDRDFYEMLVTEFRPPSWLVERLGVFDYRVLPLLILFGLTAISFIVLAFHRRVSVMRVVLFAGFSFLAWQATRNLNLFALVGGVVLCGNLSDIIRVRSTAETTTTVGASYRVWLERAAMAALSLAIAAALVGFSWRGPFGRFFVGPMPGWYAYHATKFAGDDALPKRAFVSHFGQAALYLYHHGPERKVFMDGRLEVASRETAEKYVRVKQAIAESDLGFEEIIRGKDGELPVVILDLRRSMQVVDGMRKMPTWRLVYMDEVATVFVKEAAAEKAGLPAAPFKLPAGYQ